MHIKTVNYNVKVEHVKVMSSYTLLKKLTTEYLQKFDVDCITSSSCSTA